MDVRSPSKSPRPPSQLRKGTERKMGSQRSINNLESVEPPKREDKYRTATNLAHKKNA